MNLARADEPESIPMPTHAGPDWAKQCEAIAEDIARAEGAVAGIDAKVAGLMAERATIAADLAELHRVARWLAAKAGLEAPGVEARPAPVVHRAGGESCTDAAFRVLAKAGCPMKVLEILAELDREDRFPANLPRNVRYNAIYAGMHRSPARFVKLPGKLWRIRTWGD